MRVKVNRAGTNLWDVQVLGRTSGDIKQGDVLLLCIYARGSSDDPSLSEATGTAYLQRNSGAYDKVVSLPLAASSEWKQYFAAVQSTLTLPSGQHEFTIHLAAGAQTIDIGGVSFINYGNSRTLAEMPRTKITYVGAEPDAPWRADAAAAIDKIRKADLTVHVVNADGDPIPGAAVHVVQKRHEFGFGTAVAADGLNTAGDNGDKYREVVRTWFNKAVLENDLKWPGWEQNRNRALNAIAWLRDNNLTVRGHNLVWPNWQYLPADVQKLSGDPDALRKRVLDHIAEEVAATRGQLVEWDVLNEPVTNTDLQKILGEQEMAAWFRKTREYDNWPMLFVNDYNIIEAGGLDRGHQDGYYNTIRKLIDWGAPLDAIGIQGHFDSRLTPPTRVWAILDRFAQFEKPIEITEFDINLDDEALQAQYTRDLMTAVFSHPSVSGFLMWGFWEGRHWLPRAAMFRRDWSLKPNGQTYYDLVYKEWWTDVRGETADDGAFAVRGFKGDYEIQATVGDRVVTVPVTLDARGSEVTVKVE